MSPAAKFALGVYFLTTFWLLILQPDYCFVGGQPRQFGLAEDQTVCPFYLTALLVALPIYIIALFVYKTVF